MKYLSFRLPEVPPDTAETNCLMRVHELPSFSKINPNNIITGCAKLSIEYDVDLGKQLETLKGMVKQTSHYSII